MNAGAVPEPTPEWDPAPGMSQDGSPASVEAALQQSIAPGDTPGDPRELLAPPPSPNAVAPANIVEPPLEGPPAPQPATDAILAKLPPTPSQPLGEAMPGADRPVTAEGVNDKQAELDRQKAEDAVLAADDARAAALAHQKEIHDALDHGNVKLEKARAAHDEAFAKYTAMQPHELQPSLMSAIAVAFGGIGAGLSAAGGGSSENRALTVWNKRVDDDYKHQLGQIEKARETVLMAATGIDDAKEAKSQALEDASAKYAATKAMAETEARQQMADRGIPAAAIDADSRILTLQAARQKAQIDADQRHKKDAMEEARLHLVEAQTERQKAAAAKDARGKGGGGAGGGASKPGAIAEFKGAIVDGTDDGKGGTRPLDAREIQKVADRLGIPATAKAGRPSVENLTKDVAFVAGQKNKAEAADLRRGDKIDSELQKELYPAGGRGPGTQLERIEAMRGELKDAIASGDKTAATRVLEEAGGMLSGGKSTKNTVHLLEELKSNSDKMSSLWGRITSNPGDTKEYTRRLDKLLEGAGAEKKLEIDSITKRYEERRNKGKPGTAPAAATGPVATAKAALESGDTKALLESARAEVAKKGPHAADAQRYIDKYGS